MSDLLASCAAANAVSTPPKRTEPDPTETPEAGREGGTRRDAA
ncbi:hypothetical protein [Streptomyces sp. ERV7]